MFGSRPAQKEALSERINLSGVPPPIRQNAVAEDHMLTDACKECVVNVLYTFCENSDGGFSQQRHT